MPDLLGVLETSLYVDAFERACPFYEQVLGLNSIYRDARLCAYDVGGRGVLLSVSARRLACALTSARRHSAAARRSWPDSYGFFHRRRRACGLGSAARRSRRRDREPSQMATRRRKHLFPRSRRPRARVGDAGIVAGVLVGRRIPDKAQRVSDAPQIRDRQNLKRVSRSRVCSAPLSCCAAPGKRWKTTTAHTPERCRRG